jgi:hypothetical protein
MHPFPVMFLAAAWIGGALAFAAPAQAPATSQAPQAAWWDRTAPRPGARLPQSRYYVIRSDLGTDETKRWADLLDTMYDEYTRRLVQRVGMRRRSPDHPNVYMFSRQQDYLDTLRTQFGVNATGSGGMFFITPRGSGLAFFTENLPRQRVAHVVQHEGFHQYAHAFFGNELPPWLNEGLAEFFGESVVEGRSVVVGQASPTVVDQVRSSVEQDKTIPFSDILQMDDARWNGAVRSGNARQQYMQAWSMVHFLVYAENGRYEPYFTNMLRLLNDGVKPYDAMRRAFSLDSEPEFRAFETRWKDYARNAKPGAYVAARGRLEFLAEGIRVLWSKGARPATFDELKAALREEKFRWTASAHGYTITLDAKDDANFAVPDDEVNAKPPTIELVAQKAPKSAKERKLWQEHPLPPMLRTRGLRPNDVGIAWRRDPNDPATFLYDVVVN